MYRYEIVFVWCGTHPATGRLRNLYHSRTSPPWVPAARSLESWVGRLDALVRVAAGGTALDPEVVAQWVGSSAKRSTLDALTAREREVLDLMAQGLTNAALAASLHVSERAIEKHVGNIFGKLGLPPSDTNHRRVMAVLQYLGQPSGTAS